MNIDLVKTPFSRYGSYMAISRIPKEKSDEPGLYLRSLHCTANPKEFFLIELLKDGTVVDFQEQPEPSKLTLTADQGSIEFILATPKILRFRSTGGLSLRLTRPGGMIWGECGFPAYGKSYQLNNHMQQMQSMLTPVTGDMVIDTKWSNPTNEHFNVTFTPAADGNMEGILEEFNKTWVQHDYTETFDDCLAEVNAAFNTWLDKVPKLTAEYEETRQLAAYVNWSSVVEAEGYLNRPAMVMSKNWMFKVWSWDNCFNAIGMSTIDPDLSWDQFMIPFDRQDELGVLPDVTGDLILLWAFNKPPIQGWVLFRLMEVAGYMTDARYNEIYQPLCNWTDWWFNYRDYDGDGFPQYNHGNDSGWDNATTFELCASLESPDLMAFLIVQMDCLSVIAEKLGKTDEAAVWKTRAEDAMAKLIDHSWNGEQFVSKINGTHEISPGDCLLNYIPVILGKRLPEGIRKKVVAGLLEDGRFKTEYGFATESVKSEFYTDDGYWRGPIWAPSTQILLDGLKACGEEEIAADFARRFVVLCHKSGMSENFDAVTGDGLCDGAYTWSSSVFLTLARENL